MSRRSLRRGKGIPFVDVVGYFDLGFSRMALSHVSIRLTIYADNLTKITGKHSFKLGFDMRRFEIYNPFAHINNGTFTFNGTGSYSTGDPGADFLLGVPYQYEQGSGDILNERTQEYYSYFQDQWKVKPNLTLTYGVGWSVDTPAVDNYHDNHAGIAFRPGQQSTVFPTAPEDYVFQGDPASTPLAPRITSILVRVSDLPTARIGVRSRVVRARPAFAPDLESTSTVSMARPPSNSGFSAFRAHLGMVLYRRWGKPEFFQPLDRRCGHGHNSQQVSL